MTVTIELPQRNLDGKIIWRKIQVSKKLADKQLALPVSQRIGDWKHARIVHESTPQESATIGESATPQESATIGETIHVEKKVEKRGRKKKVNQTETSSHESESTN